ncbi:MAG: NADH-quinone oxidoreductase subunit H [Planctomycetes bacterium]|nr:NADH-quinone oxidoreductase subunit H [Planctomycetota bacterium]MCB9935946.1 NADH-quinone oxidoreductase subunit H [Planctomycetota bacterium]
MFLAEGSETGRIALEALFNAAKVVVVFGVIMTVIPGMIWLERKMAAWIQLRDGPTKVGLPNWKILGPLAGWGMFGLLQPLADMFKLILKEDFMPRRVSKALFFLAPAMVFVPIALAFAVIPFGHGFNYTFEDGTSFFVNYQIADFGVGILFALAFLSLAVHGLSLGGWASNNKYSLFGAVRAGAQLISYEAAMFMVILAMVMTYGSLDLGEIALNQADHGWGIIRNLPLGFVGFVIFCVCAYAESNRLPFDFPEAEAELIGGYHTEFGSMKFAMFFLGEYYGMVIQSCLVVTLFLGGWTFPGIDPRADTFLASLAGPLIFCIKVGIFLWLYIQVRWTLPRFRFDQLMNLGWKKLIPLSLGLVVLTAIVLNIANAR